MTTWRIDTLLVWIAQKSPAGLIACGLTITLTEALPAALVNQSQTGTR